MSTSTLSPEIEDFAAAVRAALDDLPRDDVDDLTDGLEADLAEQLEDSGDDTLGDPVAYADELRSAAGLAPRGPSTPVRRSLTAELAAIPGRAVEAGRALVERHPILARLGAFLAAVRPIWWLLRGWTLYLLVITVVGGGRLGNGGYDSTLLLQPLPIAILVASIVLSVQWGRGRWMPWRWVRGLVTAGSVVAVVAIPFALAWAVTQVNDGVANAQYVASAASYPMTGLRQGDHQITNLFAYGADGEPIGDVRLYDQDGRQVRVNDSPADPYWQTDDGTALVPGDTTGSGSGWNIYPLQRVAPRDVQFGELSEKATRHDADAPYVSVPALPGDPVDMTPAPAAPSATPTPTPPPGG